MNLVLLFLYRYRYYTLMFHNFSSKAFTSIQMFKEDYFFKGSIAKQYKWIDGRQLSTQEIPPWMQVAVLYNIVSRGKKSCGQTHTHGLCEPIIAV